MSDAARQPEVLARLVAEPPRGVRVALAHGRRPGAYRQAPGDERVLELRVRWLDRLTWSDVWVPALLLAFFALGIVLLGRSVGLGVMMMLLFGLTGIPMFVALVRTLVNRTIVRVDRAVVSSELRPITRRRRVVVARATIAKVQTVTSVTRYSRSKGPGTLSAHVWLRLVDGSSVLLCAHLPTRSSTEYLARVLCAVLELPAP